MTIQFNKDGSALRRNNDSEDRLHSPAPLIDRMNQVAASGNNRTGFLAKLFPNAEERAKAQARLELIKTDGEFYVKALVVHREAQLESFREAAEHYIIRQRVEVRQQIATHILSEQKKLQDNLNQITEEFTESMEEKMQKAERIEREFLRNIRMKQLEEDAIEFANLQQNLLERFRRSLPEHA
jgi:hypothetical protein